MGAKIVAGIRSFIPATDSIIELNILYSVTKVVLVVAGNEGNLLIEELPPENSNNINLRSTSVSYNQTSLMTTQV